MPTSLHPQAKFDPIPPDLDLNGLVDRTPNLKWVQRVSRIQMQNLGQQEFEKVVLMHVILGGKPLVIDGWETILPNWLFSADWLEQTYDKKRGIALATWKWRVVNSYLQRRMSEILAPQAICP